MAGWHSQPLSQDRGNIPQAQKKNLKNLFLRFALFIIFFQKHCKIEPHPCLVRYLHLDLAGSLARFAPPVRGKRKSHLAKLPEVSEW